MNSQLSSRFFQEFPEKLEPDAQFARDLRTLLDVRDRLKGLEETLYDLSIGSSPSDEEEAVITVAGEAGLERGQAVAILRASFALLKGIEEHGTQDGPEQWISDLVNAGAISSDDREAMGGLLEKLVEIFERNQARRRVDYGVLPSLQDLQFTTELRRTTLPHSDEVRVVGICSIALHLDVGPQRQVYFQLNKRQLDELSQSLADAKDELETLEKQVDSGENR